MRIDKAVNEVMNVVKYMDLKDNEVVKIRLEKVNVQDLPFIYGVKTKTTHIIIVNKELSKELLLWLNLRGCKFKKSPLKTILW